ncbi:MAG: LptA/OstA family protein [Phreatobacter sp.]|nr:LptA/OstA family protein [Phreatobacter sp.]
MTPALSAAFPTLKQVLAAAALTAGLLSTSGAFAQQAGSPFVGFTQNRSEPINFEADRAEVFDNEKRAVLSGNVRIQQGESTLQTARLVIFYEGSAAASAGRPATTTPRQGGGDAASPTQNVRRFEMQGGVVVRSKNQTATAERGSFDARRNEAIMEGNVTLTQCENVLRGARLHADLTANRVRLDAAPSGGRVSGILQGGGGSAPGGGVNNPDCTPARPAQRGPRG